MTGFAIQRPPTAFSAPRQRKPRKKAGEHLAAIRELSCLTCGARPVEAAHIRMACLAFGKRETGMAEKPSDQWTLPLCSTCHRTGPDAQHAGAELGFYQEHSIDPFVVAMSLWAASPDIEAMEHIVRSARGK